MTDEQLAQASEMWKSGASGMVIAETIGVTRGSFNHHARTKHDIFPPRVVLGFRGKIKTPVHVDRGDTMVWVTQFGAKVTLA